jgi:hypothetical protein
MLKLVRTHEGQRAEEPRAGDFYVVVSELGTWYVSPEAAMRIGRALDRAWPRAQWIKFIDRSGSRVWLRAGSIESVYECTEASRARDRQFHYLRRKEDRADRRWDDEEY